MSASEVTYAVAEAAGLYYAFGLIWIGIGLLPGPLRWLNHNGSIVVDIVILIFGAAIWPLILGRIVYDRWNGKGTTEL